MSDITVLAVVGSLRAASLNRELAEVLAQNPPPGVRVEIADGIADVPFYNEDIDTDTPPAAVTALRERIRAADALLFLAPPNNGTLSAVLKNVIDWGSRPYGASVLSGKQVALAGVGHRLDTTMADAERAVTIAGGEVPVGLIAEFPISGLEGKSPRDHADVVRRAGELVEKLAAAAR